MRALGRTFVAAAVLYALLLVAQVVMLAVADIQAGAWRLP